MKNLTNECLVSRAGELLGLVASPPKPFDFNRRLSLIQADRIENVANKFLDRIWILESLG